MYLNKKIPLLIVSLFVSASKPIKAAHLSDDNQMPQKQESFYDILAVKPSATQNEIKKAAQKKPLSCIQIKVGTKTSLTKYNKHLRF